MHTRRRAYASAEAIARRRSEQQETKDRRPRVRGEREGGVAGGRAGGDPKPRTDKKNKREREKKKRTQTEREKQRGGQHRRTGVGRPRTARSFQTGTVVGCIAEARVA